MVEPKVLRQSIDIINDDHKLNNIDLLYNNE